MTGINRVGSVTLLNSALQDITKVQSKLGDLQNQISGGLKAESFEQLNGQVEFYTQLTSKQRLSSQFQSGNDVAIGRMQTADQAVSSAQDIADNMGNLILTGLNSSNANSLNFEQQMRDFLNSFADQLNTTYQGNYIFGGTNTSTPPVPDTTIQNATTGLPDDVYYAGSKDDIVLRANERITYQFPVRADDSSFQKVYAAAQQAIKAFNAGDHTGLQSAMDLMKSGQKDLVNVRTKLNSAIVNTKALNDQLSASNTYLKSLTDQVSQTDIVEASTKVSQYEAILQATFQVYSRLSQLRLSQYL